MITPSMLAVAQLIGLLLTAFGVGFTIGREFGEAKARQHGSQDSPADETDT